MSITLKKIKWKNLQGSGNYFTEVELDKYKFTLLSGNNGSSKTTLLIAICYGLFGKVFSDATLPSIINNINNKNLQVELEFQKSKTSYRVVRGQKPDVFEIYKNDEKEPIKQTSKPEYQKTLEKILGFDYNTFIRFAIFVSDNYTPFMKMKAQDKRNLIDALFDLEVITNMNDLAKADLKEIKKKIQTIENDILRTNLSIDSKTKLKEDITLNYKSKKKDIQNNIIKNKEETDKKLQSIKVYENKLKELDIKKYEDIQDSLKEEFKAVSKEIIEINTKNKLSENDLKFLEENDTCPKCKQEILNKEELKDSIIILDTVQLLNKKIEIEDKLDKLDKWFKGVENIRNTIKNLQSDVKSFEREKEFYQKELEKLEQSFKTDYDKELKELQNTLQELEEKLNKKLEKKKVIEVSLELLKDSGIRANIIKTYLPVLNDLINKYLEKFEVFVKFELDEEFNDVLKSRHYSKQNYRNFSGGEKTAVDLSILLSFREIARRKNNFNLNLLGFDETLEKIDANRGKLFMKILRSIENTNTIIISHNEDIKSLFGSEDLIINCKKVGNFCYHE